MSAQTCPNYITTAAHPHGKVSTLQFQGDNFVSEPDGDNGTNGQEKKDFFVSINQSLVY